MKQSNQGKVPALHEPMHDICCRVSLIFKVLFGICGGVLSVLGTVMQGTANL